MASGIIPLVSNWLSIIKLSTSSTTSDKLIFSDNNERHLIIAIGPALPQNLVFIAKTSNAGAASHIVVGGEGGGLTFTDGTKSITIAHNSASMVYVDFVIVGSPLSL